MALTNNYYYYYKDARGKGKIPTSTNLLHLGQ